MELRAAFDDVLVELVRRRGVLDAGGLRERFEAGGREHGDFWEGWPLERFGRERAEELDDAVLYRAMELAVLRRRAL